MLLRRNLVSHTARGFCYSPTLPRADDSGDKFAFRERQEALLLEKVPLHLNDASKLAESIGWSADAIMLMKSGIGEFTGRAVVLAPPTAVLPKIPSPETLVRSIDRSDTELFVEQCQRLAEFTSDIRRIAEVCGRSEEDLQRVVTLTGLPKTFSRADVVELVQKATKGLVTVETPRDVVFRFKKHGYQSDTCFVLLRSSEDCLAVIKAAQEYPVAKRSVYGTEFGCSFVHADRSALFLSDPSLDYVLGRSKYWVMSLGWSSELGEEGMKGVLEKLAIFPNKVVSVGTGSFLLRFDRMKNAKLVFARLQRLKRRWRIGTHVPFFAYPVRADLHFSDSNGAHADEALDDDTDLDEPVMY